MSRKWFSIAKAEYLVSTVSLRDNRKRNMCILFVFGFFWAIVIAPYLIGFIIGLLIPIGILRSLLISLLPGLMRSVMFFIWVILLVIPLSRALQELKIGQWEIFLSNNVKTKEILTGSFLGKVPFYTLLVLYIAPPFLAVLFITFEVVLVGQILIYLVLIVMVLATIWLSNLITAAIQAKLGESARGKDLANGLAILLAIVTIIPIYGIMFYSQQMSLLLGMNIFLLFPFTWPADTISWLTVLFSSLNFSLEQLLLFQQVLQFNLLVNTMLFVVFGLACVGLGLLMADRIFTYNIGARTEQITTVKGDSAFYRGIRKLAPGSFGTLVITCMKDFFRKASNLSKIAYGLILAVLLPIVMTHLMTSLGETGSFDMMTLFMVGGIGLAVIGSFTFSGTSFMESKDQLWIIQTTPSGTSRFVNARLVSAFIIAIPLCIIPTVVLTILAAAGIELLLILLVYAYAILCGSIIFATGVTAWNPHYENTKSPEHQMNIIITMLGVQMILIVPMIVIMFSDILGLPFWDLIITTVGRTGLPFAFALIGLVALFGIGGITLITGTRALARPEH
ncbi:MAG: hypothetical protein ACFFCJ_07530 [Promethearchaeota archaeon]